LGQALNDLVKALHPDERSGGVHSRGVPAQTRKTFPQMAQENEQHQAGLSKLRAINSGRKPIGSGAPSRHPPTADAMLGKAENKIAELDVRIEAQRPPDIKASTEEIRDYVLKSVARPQECFFEERDTEDQSKARAACKRTCTHA
jgi:hypothetical protein